MGLKRDPFGNLFEKIIYKNAIKNNFFSTDRMTSRGTKSTVADATPAILMVIAVFSLPTKYKFWPFRFLLKYLKIFIKVLG